MASLLLMRFTGVVRKSFLGGSIAMITDPQNDFEITVLTGNANGVLMN